MKANIGFHLQEILGKLEIEKGIYYPHNYLFESLAIGGILMTLPLFYCMFFPMIGFYKNLKIDPNVLPSGRKEEHWDQFLDFYKNRS